VKTPHIGGELVNNPTRGNPLETSGETSGKPWVNPGKNSVGEYPPRVIREQNEPQIHLQALPKGLQALKGKTSPIS